MEDSKACSRCKQVLKADSFAASKRNKSGLHSWCRQCSRSYSRNYRRENPDRMAKYELKRQTSSQEYAQQYYKKHKDILRVKNKQWRDANADRKRLTDNAWRLSNPEKVKKNQKQYYERNPEKVSQRRHKRRAMLKNARCFLVRPQDIKKIMSKPCVYCGSPSSHLDHVIPISRGGLHSIGNLVASCQKCNLSKNKKLLAEWKYKLMQSEAKL